MIEYSRLLDVLGVEGELLASSAEEASEDAPVAMCPGMTVGGTLRHVGSVYRLVIAWLDEGKRPDSWHRDQEPGESAMAYYREALRVLLERLAARPPDEYASTWWPADNTYGFWWRRMAHETVVHRTDVQAAAGLVRTEVPEDLALDGVDEVLALWFAQKLPVLGLSGTKSGTVAVRTGGHAWVTRAGPGETTARRCSAAEAEAANAVVSGDPAQIYLWLWGRLPLTAVVFGGEFDLAGQLWALLRLATR